MSRSPTERRPYTAAQVLAERETPSVDGVFSSRKDALHASGSEGSRAFRQSLMRQASW